MVVARYVPSRTHACISFIPPVCLRGTPVRYSPLRPRHRVSMEGRLSLHEGTQRRSGRHKVDSRNIPDPYPLLFPPGRIKRKIKESPSPKCAFFGRFLRQEAFRSGTNLYFASEVEVRDGRGSPHGTSGFRKTASETGGSFNLHSGTDGCFATETVCRGNPLLLPAHHDVP